MLSSEKDTGILTFFCNAAMCQYGDTGVIGIMPKRTELHLMSTYQRLLYDGIFIVSESLNCFVCLPLQLVSEQQESRPLLSPSIDDFLCETKCDGVSRPVTSNTAGTVQLI